MSKVTGNYSSLVKGVSQQAPADRLEGQHGEQLNMLSDAIRGLVRRNGSILEAQSLQAATGSPGDAIADSFSYRTFSYTSQAREFDLLYRSRAKYGASANHLSGLVVYDKTPNIGTGFVPVVTAVSDTGIAAYMDGGFSAVTSIGDYILLAGLGVQPAYTSDDKLVGETWTTEGVVWIRGGAYARTYTLTAVKASTGVSYTVTYTTKTAAYNGTLDTSGISYAATDYQKQINDLTYAYNSTVNKWISDASADIVPANIAQKLIDALTAAGFTGWTRNGSHIGSTDLASCEVSDGGDGSLMVGLLTNTPAADEVTDMHYIGKVVKVQPNTGSSEAYFLKAYAHDGASGATGIRPVIWRETAGVLQTPTRIFAVGGYYKGTFYVASTPTALQALVLASTGDTIVVPQFIASMAGDLIGSAPPHFYGRTITALSLFQDRLIVVSGGTVNMSRPGDYFNFYRSSVLTVADDDPIEIYALGVEGDTIRKTSFYEKSLLLVGDKYHFAISGRFALTPTTAAMAVQHKIDNTAGSAPVINGNLLFTLKEDTELAACRLMQTQAGMFQDSPQISDVSQQLRDYINGTPAEIVALAAPEIVFVRTEAFLKSTGAFPRSRPSGLYVYQYIDAPNDQRLHDAWSAWEWSLALGTPIGIAPTADSTGLMVYTLAWGKDETGANTRAINAMSFSARPDPSGLPYLDGMRRAELAAINGLLTHAASAEVKALVCTAAGAAYSNSPPSISDASRFTGLEHPHYTMGDAPPETVDPFRWTGCVGNLADYIAAYPTGNTGDLWTGLTYPAFVDPTCPFVRDFKGKARVDGKLTLTRLTATLIRTAGFDAKFIDNIGTHQCDHFAGEFARIRYTQHVWIGRDTRYVQVRLAAKDWLPLTINALGWSGQWFPEKSR